MICFCAVLLVGLLFYDERLDPELARELAEPFPDVLAPGNAWIAILGLDAPPGEMKPYAYGEERLRKRRQEIASGKKFGELIGFGIEDNQKLQIPSSLRDMRTGLLSKAAKHAGEIAALAKANDELLSRFEGLATYSHYCEPLKEGILAPNPNYLLVRKVCQLRLLESACKAEKGDLDGALTEVDRIAEFSRFLASNAQTLLPKMVGLKVVDMTLRFAAELGVLRDLTDTQRAMVESILRPFDQGEVSMERVRRGEVLGLLVGLEYGIREVPWPQRSLIKPNASRNAYFERLRKATVCFGAVDSRTLARQYAAYNTVPARRIGVWFLYNPIGGSAVVDVDPILYREYAVYAHNTEGLRRLCALKVSARREGIAENDMQAFLDRQKNDFGDPYTGKAMLWNPREETIFFPRPSKTGTVALSVR